MKKFRDQMGCDVKINFPPQRIISIVPSQTELLHYLDLGIRVVGITKFCVHPQDWYRSKPRVGGTKKLNFTKIKELQPDLIIGNKEENDEAQIKRLMEQYPVWMSDVKTLDDAYDMIGKVGDIAGKKEKTGELISAIQKEFEKLRDIQQNKRRAAYFIWRDPFMVAGGDTFINEMMDMAGFENVFKNQQRYPEISSDEIRASMAEVILLSSEPYPFKEKHIAEIREIYPQADVILVDGEMFSWYGSRLLQAPDYFLEINKKAGA